MPTVRAGRTIVSSNQINPGIIVNSDVNASAAIEGSKLQALSVGANAGVIPSTGIADAHIAATAAIAFSKLASGTQGGVLIFGASGVPTALTNGSDGQVLTSQGAGANAQWETPAGGMKTGVSSRAGDAASGDQVIAHGLGATPTKIEIIARWRTSVGSYSESHGAWDGTNNRAIFNLIQAANAVTGTDATATVYAVDAAGTTDRQTATVAVDGTNITLTWTKTGTTSSTTIYFLWKAWA